MCRTHHFSDAARLIPFRAYHVAFEDKAELGYLPGIKPFEHVLREQQRAFVASRVLEVCGGGGVRYPAITRNGRDAPTFQDFGHVAAVCTNDAVVLYSPFPVRNYAVDQGLSPLTRILCIVLVQDLRHLVTLCNGARPWAFCYAERDVFMMDLAGRQELVEV